MLNQPRTVGTLDEVLYRICEQLQLTKDQYDNATGRYERVGEWLAEKGTKVASLRPVIFPQGSMLLRTTNRPMSKDEEVVPFDLDLVGKCFVDPTNTHARALYELLKSRLHEHGDFKARLIECNRCLRLAFPSDSFHLDIIPACPDPSDPSGVTLLIPDRTLWKKDVAPIQSWKATDPVRFAAWFEANCAIDRDERRKMFSASVAPVPPRESTLEKAPLRNVTQLIKRQRDISFLGDDCIPSSILITTLAGNHYQGNESLCDALDGVLSGILRQIAGAAPKRINVPNPTNQAEDFAAPMTDAAYKKFCNMLHIMRQNLADAKTLRGIPNIKPKLSSLFGEHTTGKALSAMEKDAKQALDDNRLGTAAQGAGLAILGSAKPKGGVQPMPPNNFHLNRQ